MTNNTAQRVFIIFCSAMALLILLLSPWFIFDDTRQHPWLSCALFAFGMLLACIPIIVWKTPEQLQEVLKSTRGSDYTDI